MGHLGLGLHKVLGDEDQMSVISFRVNRLRFRTYGNYLPDKAKRRGLEIHPSARLFFGDRYGLYLEAFYKFQLFKPFNTDVTWNYNFSGETGTLPGSNSHVFGINLGFFMPYAN